MSNPCIVKLPHSCGTKKGLQVFEGENGTVNGYCFSCGTYVEHPFGNPKKNEDVPHPERKSEEEIRKEIQEVALYPTLTVESRKLRDSNLEAFDVKTSVSEEKGLEGGPTALYYPYMKDGKLSGYKIKTLGQKRIYSIGDLKEVEPFGWDKALQSSSKRIIITEGEDDAIVCRYVLHRYSKKEYADNIPAVISIPHGSASAAKDLALIKDTLQRKFKDIVLCFDEDDAGRKAVESVMQLFPSARSTSLPHKDAHECLMKGFGKALFQELLFNATAPKNTKLVFGSDIHEEASKEPEYGELTWPWDQLNRKTRGIRYGETIYIGAGVKLGKSELANALAAHFIKAHDTKVLMAKPEENNKKTYKMVAGKLVGSKFHDPDVPFDQEKFDKAGKMLDDRLALLNTYQRLGWESLKDDIVSAVHWGAKVVFIDPITNLTNGMPPNEANTKLQEVAQELATMALDLNIVIFIFCHLKAPEGNIPKERRIKHYSNGEYIGLGSCPHELGGDVLSTQFAGSRAMMRSCNLMIGLEGNKDEELPEESRVVRRLKILEDREFGETGSIRLSWNPQTSLYKELD